MASGSYETVKIEREDGANAGITWVILNRPEKRNAMSPQLHFDMVDVLNELESDARTRVVVLTGAGEAWCAGQDLKLYSRDLDNKPAERARAAWASHYWRWQKLFTYAKPTIAMVNGSASAAASPSSSPAISPSRPRTRSLGCPRSTGAFCPAASSARR